ARVSYLSSPQRSWFIEQNIIHGDLDPFQQQQQSSLPTFPVKVSQSPRPVQHSSVRDRSVYVGL
ncbi:hypothetical protein FRC03_006614, partial [Tulasnella sp. 419]